jgi:nucleotide-binding universal stress UspA family protein
MDSPRNILCATDFGPPSKRAVTVALALAKAFEGSVTLIHVFDAPVLPGAPFMPLNDKGPQVEKEARHELDAAVTEARAQMDTDRGVLRRGRPWEEVIAMGGDMRADLIVVGTRVRATKSIVAQIA